MLAAIPPLRLVLDLFAAGENIPSNDDMIFLQIMDRVTAPGYDWTHFFKDTFVQGHSFWLGQLLFMPYAAAGLDQYTGISIGIILMLVRFYLVQDMLLPRAKQPASSLKQTIALVLMSAVFFAPNNACILSHGTFAIIWQISLLGTTLMLWALTRHTERWSVAIATLGLLINAGTVGDALPMIPLTIAWYWWHKHDSRKNIAIFGTAAALACLPYLLYLHTGAANSDALSKTYFGLDIMRFASTLARNFATGTGWHYGYMDTATSMTGFGLVLAVVLIIYARKHKQTFAPADLNALLLATYSVVTIGIIGIFRSLILPWYGLIAMYFWLALLALASRCDNRYLTATTYLTVLSFALFAPHFADKEFFLANRTPVFVSVLREPQSMPDLKVYTGPKIIGLDMQHFSEILKKHKLPPFSAHQQILMQGDTGLQDRVQLSRSACWTDPYADKNMDMDERKISPAVAQRLTLELSTEGEAAWKTIIPAGYTRASFNANLQVPQDTKGLFKITVRSADLSSIISKNVIISQRVHDIALPLPIKPMFGGQFDITLKSNANKKIRLGQPLISLD